MRQLVQGVLTMTPTSASVMDPHRGSCGCPGFRALPSGSPFFLAVYLIRSEYATLKFLENTAVPGRRAFSFGIPSQDTDHGI